MDLLSNDILLHISKFLCNNTCCTLSDVHKLALTNKYYFNIYKENITILPLIPSDHISKIYKNIIHAHRFNCYLCGPFNKIEINNIINSIKTAAYIKADFSRKKNPYLHGLSNTIHFNTTYEMEILKAKTESLTHNLNFLIAGRCCSGKGSILFIKH